MEAANTQPNRALAQAVNSRITADAVMLNAKSTVWRLTGLGAMCALIGLGVGAAFFGYSYIHDPRTSAQQMAQAFAEALEKTTLTTTGEVKLDPQAAVKLDPNGAQLRVDPTSTVRLDASGAVVRLDPNAVVNVRGVTPEVPRPTDDQLNPKTLPPFPKTNVVTDYTVFKTVKLGKGAVITGWNFTSNEDVSPRHEYCYYVESIQDGISARFDLATNGRLDLKGQAPRGVDRAGAAANCVWFAGGFTRSY
jgi:hypothetical protein